MSRFSRRFFSRRFTAIALAIAVVLLSQSTRGADEGNSSMMLIELDDRNFASGQIVGLDGKSLVWKSQHFLEPLEFKLENVVGVVAAVQPEADQKVDGDFRIELANNRDVLFGNLVSVDSESVEIKSARTGTIKLPRTSIVRVNRVGNDRNVYAVPTRLEDWNTSSDEHWESDGNGIASETKGSTAFADVDLTAKTAIEVELAWENKPSFQIHFGVFRGAKQDKIPFSIEAWDDKLIAQRSTDKQSDLTVLTELTSNDSIQLVVYLDQTKGVMIVSDASGKPLGEVRLTDEEVEDEFENGIRFANHDQLAIKHLRIRGWSGLVAESVEAQTSIRTADGTQAAEQIKVASDELEFVTEDGTERKIPLAKIQEIDFGNSPSSAEHEVVATWNDGMRLTGKLVGLSSETLTMQTTSEELAMSAKDLRGLFFIDKETGEQKVVMTEEDAIAKRKNESYADWYARRREILKRKVTKESEGDASKKAASTKARKGMIELMDTRLRGYLVDSAKGANQCLVWQCIHANNAATLKQDAFGRIVYVERKPKKKATTNTARANRAIFMNGIQQSNTRPKARREKLAGAAVHLRSGDTIPCTVTKIDETAVHIDSKLTETKSIPHEYVKAAQLTSYVSIPPLSKKKKSRFLTLPRMHRDVPPQHLLFSTKGDVLRGSVMAMREQQLQLEVRLDSHTIPRQRVSAIVWLHKDEIESTTGADGEPEAKANEDVDKPLPGIEVQAVGSTGSRFTFFANAFGTGELRGKSAILQDVKANVNDVDQFLIGGFIRRAARSLPFHRWRLTSARDPKFVTEGDEESQETKPGTESSLVGGPAPPIKLKMLDGSRFELAKHKGDVVVLDFWASWCGPCLQVMPKVEEVVDEFKEDGVKLFAINLEETKERVEATLERRGLKLPVVLDRDGVAAQRYEASAIPQTVVIAPDGTIARVFVGSSRNFSEQLRTAIEEVLEKNL